MLRKECRSALSVNMYMKHIIVHAQNADPASTKVLKEEIIGLVGQHFPQRKDILAIVITSEETVSEDFLIRPEKFSNKL